MAKDLHREYDEFLAKRKLHLLLRSHCTAAKPLQIGDMVHIYVKHSLKMGKASDPKVVLSIDQKAGYITVLGRTNIPVTVAFEDDRLTILCEHLSLCA